MMDKISSDQDELYYTAKNFHKLKYSNSAYIENMTKDNQDLEGESEALKKEYEKLKVEVMNLKRKNLYTTGRIKSAGHSEEAEGNLLRQKLDYARSQKQKAKAEWKKLEEALKGLRGEAKLIADDNNPYVRRIKLLENQLDKAMIKFNEAGQIRRTYEQILSRLKEERAGYDNQISAIQKSLKSKEHDCQEFKLLLQDAKQAKAYSELLLKNTKLSKEAFEQHFESLIKAHQQEAQHELKPSQKETRKEKKIQLIRTDSGDSFKMNNSAHSEQLLSRVKEYEEADKKIKEVTGAEDINDICQKYSNLRETKDKLQKEKKDLDKLCESLAKKKDELAAELKSLKYLGQDEITRKEIEDNEKTAERTLKACDEVRQKLKKSEKVNVDVRAGVNMLIGILKNKVFEESMKGEDDEENHGSSFRNTLQEVIDCQEKDFKTSLSKMADVFKLISNKYKDELENADSDEENDMRLTRKEEMEIDQAYMYNLNNESNLNSEYGPDDDGDIELNNNKDKDLIHNKNESNIRPYTADGKKSNTTKYSLKAKEKK